MTEKQEKIISAALELFAQEGFRSTSTSKVAKLAGVSEGLIFRHFDNKDGLLDAIMQQGEEKAKALFAEIVFEEDPREVLRKFIGIAVRMMQDREEANFWKLQYKVKWEMEAYNAHKMEAVQHALTTAFEKLGYEDAVGQAMNLLLIFDGLATRFYLQKDFNTQRAIDFLMRNYQL